MFFEILEGRTRGGGRSMVRWIDVGDEKIFDESRHFSPTGTKMFDGQRNIFYVREVPPWTKISEPKRFET